MGYTTRFTSLNIIDADPETQLILQAEFDSSIDSLVSLQVADLFDKSAILQDSYTGNEYRNTGTVASPVLSLSPSSGSGITALTGDVTAGPGIGSQAATIGTNKVTTAKINTGAVTLAKLDAGITPSHVVKYAGTITWSGSGASKAATVTGVAATDVVVATIKTAPTQAAYIVSVAPTTNTITITLSAANTSNDAVIAYQVLRAAA